jgi:hypothetical protein
LIFRASQHGWGASDFHKNCDNKGANIVIIKNEFGYIFGGYSSISWESSNTSKYDDKAFLYSINNKIKCNVIP